VFSIDEIIDLSIQIEENGERTYRRASEKTRDPSLCAALRWLADEEAQHARWFAELKGRKTPAAEDPQVRALGRAILREMLGEQAFSLADADLSEGQHMGRLLEKAVEFEQDTVLFYEMLGSFLEEPDALSRLQEIIEEENRHIQTLREHLRG